jgi:hypothetical protein
MPTCIFHASFYSDSLVITSTKHFITISCVYFIVFIKRKLLNGYIFFKKFSNIAEFEDCSLTELVLPLQDTGAASHDIIMLACKPVAK